MTRAARTVLIFGIYIVALGATLVLVPNALLVTFGMPPTDEVWIRVVGMVLFLLGCWYVQAARFQVEAFFRFSVYARASVILFLLGFVLAGLAKPVLLLFGLIDLGAAIWTAGELRSARVPHAGQG